MAGQDADQAVLAVSHLSVEFRQREQWNLVIDDVSFSVGRGKSVGLVGESGSGKTVTAMSVMGLLSSTGGRRRQGQIMLNGRDIAGLDESAMRHIRGGEIAMIFQQPTRSLNPAFTVGAQLAEAARLHLGLSRRGAWTRAVEMLDRVQISDAARRAKDYPYAFSGGMAQRVMIAMALIGEPKLLIADEPTTALDVTVQARILDLIREVQAESGVALVFVSHDLAVISEICDDVSVFYAGQVVEQGSIGDLLRSPRHPYTAGLLGAIPTPGQGRRLIAIRGMPPDFAEMPAGCRFHPRCSYCEVGRCDAQPVDLRPTRDPSSPDLTSRHARCVRVDELELVGLER